MLDIQLKWDQIQENFPFPYDFEIPTELVVIDSEIVAFIEKILDYKASVWNEEAAFLENIAVLQNFDASRLETRAQFYFEELLNLALLIKGRKKISLPL